MLWLVGVVGWIAAIELADRDIGEGVGCIAASAHSVVSSAALGGGVGRIAVAAHSVESPGVAVVAGVDTGKRENYDNIKNTTIQR